MRRLCRTASYLSKTSAVSRNTRLTSQNPERARSVRMSSLRVRAVGFAGTTAQVHVAVEMEAPSGMRAKEINRLNLRIALKNLP